MDITSKDLREKISNGEKLLIDFYGKFCGPCKVMRPIFDSLSIELKEKNSDVQMYTFDIEDDMDYIVGLGVSKVPTIKGFVGGKEFFTEVGLKDKKSIIEMVEKLA
jgi:thioredoxin 1